MTVPPQLTSSLPSFSYPASFRHPPPASSGPMVYAFCLLERAHWAATGCIFHLCFLALGARMLVSHAGKTHAGPQHLTAPKMGPRRSASQRNASKGAGMPVLFCSKHVRLNFDCHKQCKTCVQPAAPLAPGKTGFCEWQRWFLGSGAMFACAYPHTSRGSSVKLVIRIGLAAKLLRMCSKLLSTVSHFVLAWPQSFQERAQKLLRTISQFVLARPQNYKKMHQKKKIINIFFFSSILRDTLSSFASEPLWFATHA